MNAPARRRTHRGSLSAAPSPDPRAHRRPRRLVPWAVLAACLSLAWAQPRAEVVLGVAGAPVTGAWNPLRAVVRDAPGARLTVEIDVGGLARGEVLRTATWTFPDASGVQRLDVDLPLPEWRRLNWRIEYGDRTLASGALGVRDRDERHLALVVAASPPSWYDAFDDDLRPVPAAASDLPDRAASWDGVAVLLFDGTAAAPDAATVLSAAAAGVRVLVPASDEAAYAALVPLVEEGPTRAGAGGVTLLRDPRPDARFTAAPEEGVEVAFDPSSRHELVAAAAAALAPTRWMHLPRYLVAAVAAGYGVLAWSLFRVGGPAGVSSGLLVVAAAFLAVPFAAPADPAPVSEGAVVIAAGGLGVRTDLREVATLPRGQALLPGLYVPLDPVAVHWTGTRTHLPLDPGGRARLTGPPEVVTVPDDVREGRAPAFDAPEALAGATPPGAAWFATGDTWWLVRAEDEATASTLAGTTIADRGTGR